MAAAITLPIHRTPFLTGGNHRVTLNITNSGGCFDSTHQYINITILNPDTLSGTVFNDANGNGIHDLGEVGFANQWVQVYLNGNSQYLQTDTFGNYSLIIAANTDSIFAYLNLTGYAQTLPINPNHYVVTVTANQHITGLDFGFQNINPIVSGHVFYDANGNGIQDPGEANGSNIRVDIYGNTMSTHQWTNWNGDYAVVMNGGGNINISCNPILSGLSGYTISTTPTQYNLVTSGSSIYANNNFGLQPSTSTIGDNLMINIAPASTVVPGIGGFYYVTIKNVGSTTIGGNAVFNYDAQLTYGASTLGTDNSATHQITWAVAALAPNTISTNSIWMNLSVATPLGTVLLHNAAITLPLGHTDVDTTNNKTNYSQIVVGSYDPNVKTVSPVGEGATGAINPTQANELTYTINFQNTGTAPAVNIVVKDLISTDLDVNTLQMLESSHNNTLSVDSATRMAVWKFQNIMLPDSTHDEAHSHGYLQYKIKPKASLAQGTTINNTANIYFDFNAAVVTNTTVNTVDYALGIDNIVDGNLPQINIAPNPFNQFTTISITGLKSTADVDFEMTNVLGKVILQQKVAANKFIINRNNLAAGVYLYQLKQSGKNMGRGKLVVQ